MPLVAHNQLPTYARLQAEGEEILEPGRARDQDIRELHVGLLNMMPDAAFEATERQFLRLIGSCNRIAQFYVHPFTVDAIARGPAIAAHVGAHYERLDAVLAGGLDALIITGANIPDGPLTGADFWPELVKVLEFASKRVTSTLCACLATHAALYHSHRLERRPLESKRWGVFPHRPRLLQHPLVRNVNTRFDVPHSRYNDISEEAIRGAGDHVLVSSPEAGVHLAVSGDGIRFVYFQGHPEYDRDSLLKEYKREVTRWSAGERDDYPPPPHAYLSPEGLEIADQWRHAAERGVDTSAFPSAELLTHIDNTWGDTARTVFNNWLGAVYQLTGYPRDAPFMPDVDADDPLGLRSHLSGGAP